MNCKPGDLAIVVRGVGVIPIGAIVECLELISEATLVVGRAKKEIKAKNVWIVDWGGRRASGGFDGYGVEDRDLKPIRDSDGEDETLTWAGKPEKVTA